MILLQLLFSNLPLQEIEQSFSYLQALVITVRKACFENLYQQDSEILIGENMQQTYDCFINLLFDFEDINFR